MKSRIKNILLSVLITFSLVLSLLVGLTNTKSKTYAEYDMLGNDVEVKGEFEGGTFSEHSYYHGVGEEEGSIFNDESEGAYAYFEDETDTLHLYDPINNDISEISIFDTDNKFTIYFHGNGTYTIDRINRFNPEFGDIEIVTDKDVKVLIKYIDTNENFAISGQGVVYCFTSVPEGGTVKVGKTYKASWSTCFDVDEFQIMIFDDEANDWSETPFATLNNSGFGYNAGTQVNYNLFVGNCGLIRFKICAYLDNRLVLESVSFYVQWGQYYVVYNSNYGYGYEGSNEYKYVYLDNVTSYILSECPFDAPEGKEFIGYQIEDDGELKQPGDTVNLENGAQIYAVWGDEVKPESISANYSGDAIVGDNFDASKVTLQATYNDVLAETISVNSVSFYDENDEWISNLSEFVFDKVGLVQIKVRYKGLETNLEINVVESSENGNENSGENDEQNNNEDHNDENQENNENNNEQNNNETEPSKENTETTEKSKLSGGAVAGIIIASVAVVGAGVCATVLFVRKKKRA